MLVEHPNNPVLESRPAEDIPFGVFYKHRPGGSLLWEQAT
jgi:hypothetical protein